MMIQRLPFNLSITAVLCSANHMLSALFVLAFSIETLAAISENQRISFVDYDGNGYSDIISFGKQYDTDSAKNANQVFKITGANRFGAITDTYSDPYLTIVPDYSTPTLKLVGTGRFDNDYTTDLVWKEWWGRYYIDKRNSTGLYERLPILSPEAANYTFIGIGDFNGDGRSDILWRSKTGLMRIYQFKTNSNTYDDIIISATENNITFNPQVPNDYQCSGIGDFNGDGKSDIFWVVGDGKTIFWLLDGGQIKRYFYSNPIGSTRDWRVVAVGDICSSATNGGGTIGVSDGVADIIWQGLSQTVVWQISKDSNINAFYLETPPNQTIKGVGDYNNDGNGDILVTSDSRILYNNLLPTQNQIQGVQTTLIIDIASNPYRDNVLASITPVFEGGFDLRLHTSRQFELRLRPMESTNFNMYLQPPGSYVLNNPTRWLGDINLTGMGWGTTVALIAFR
jgi:hypothetical protein